MDIGTLTEVVPAQVILWVVIVIVALAAFGVLVWKKAVATFNDARKAVNERETRITRLEEHDDRLKEMEDSVRNTKDDIREITRLTELQETMIEKLQDEEALVINTLLHIVQAMQDLGANGPTHEAELEIMAYLNRTSHGTPHELLAGLRTTERT